MSYFHEVSIEIDRIYQQRRNLKDKDMMLNNKQ